MTSNSYNCYKYLYLHGFASGSGSSKGLLLNKFFKEQLQNVELHLPDLNIPSFEKLSVSEIVKHLKSEMLNTTQQYRLIGSSLGGLVAATLASEFKECSKIQSLILLCPALDASNRWKAKMTESDLNQWQLDGSKKYYHFSTKTEQQLHYGFYEDLMKQVQYPLIDVPITIVHGTTDDIVPINTSRTYIQLLQKNGWNNELIEVNDDHLLMKTESIDVIKNVIRKRWFNE
ncbi:hypothetical protein HA402_000706 [Bradysia odoriphaga]|nr:hypothetical protein HA402_000706 [Bradysia odoriphaga]